MGGRGSRRVAYARAAAQQGASPSRKSDGETSSVCGRRGSNEHMLLVLNREAVKPYRSGVKSRSRGRFYILRSRRAFALLKRSAGRLYGGETSVGFRFRNRLGGRLAKPVA
jgi:hypothetical protein